MRNTGIVVLMLFCGVIRAQSVAKVTLIQGSAKILRTSTDQWKPLKVNMSLQIGNQLYSDEESMVEITYSNGEIVRLDENTKIIITHSTADSVKSKVGIGRVWVNMKKLSSVGRDFQVETATAVAAIRGTIFDMTANQDSPAIVSVFDGKVAVGPTDKLKKQIALEKKYTPVREPQEVPGPEEIPGPFEVSLEQWNLIVAGQRISIRESGKFMTETFDLSSQDTFVQKNQQRDKQLGK